MTTSIARWGNSLALRLPRDVVASAGLEEGTEVSLEVEETGVVVIRTAAPACRLDDLLNGIADENLHGETDWGGPAGRETW